MQMDGHSKCKLVGLGPGIWITYAANGRKLTVGVVANIPDNIESHPYDRY